MSKNRLFAIAQSPIFIIPSCIGIIAYCILMAQVEAAWWVKGHEPYRAHSFRPVQHPTIVNPHKRISRKRLADLTVHRYYSRGQSTRAMRSLLGSPYASSPDAQIEWFPIQEEPTTWYGAMYDRQGRYVNYTFSTNNAVIHEPTIEQVAGVTVLSKDVQTRNAQVAQYVRTVRGW
jgi:hypothetical protein